MPGKQELMKDSKNVSSERSSVLQVSCVCPPKEPATIIATWLVLTNYNYWRLILTTIQSARELLLLSHPSRVRLCATPQIAAHKASLSLGFSRQEHWSELPFPSPMHECEKWKWSHSVVSDSSDPMDCSPPGSSVHGIFQTKVLEWGAIAFSQNSHRI